MHIPKMEIIKHFLDDNPKVEMVALGLKMINASNIIGKLCA